MEERTIVEVADNSDPIKLSENNISYLQKSSKWMRFIGDFYFFTALIVLIIALAVLVFDYFPFPQYILNNGPVMLTSICIVYMVIAVLYCLFGVYLLCAAKYFIKAINDKTALSMEKALYAEKRYWKFTGIFTMVALGITLLLLIGSVAFTL